METPTSCNCTLGKMNYFEEKLSLKCSYCKRPAQPEHLMTPPSSFTPPATLFWPHSQSWFTCRTWGIKKKKKKRMLSPVEQCQNNGCLVWERSEIQAPRSPGGWGWGEALIQDRVKDQDQGDGGRRGLRWEPSGVIGL